MLYRAYQRNRKMGEELKPGNSRQITFDFNPDDEAKISKRIEVKSWRMVPKGIL